MNLVSEYKTTIGSILLTPILIWLALIFTGGGHRFWPVYLLFPWGMTGTVFQNTISYPFLAIGILQFPFYGFVLDRTRKNGRLGVAFLLIVIQHAILVSVLLLTRGENWVP